VATVLILAMQQSRNIYKITHSQIKKTTLVKVDDDNNNINNNFSFNKVFAEERIVQHTKPARGN
jgi:hypothetical protein